MNKYSLYRIALFLSIGLTLIGAVFQIQQWTGGTLLLFTGIITSLIYIVIGIMDVVETNDKSIIEKFLWFVGFVFLSTIIGLVYYIFEIRHKLYYK